MGRGNSSNWFKLILIYSLIAQTATAYSFCGYEEIERNANFQSKTKLRDLEVSYTRESEWSPIRIQYEIIDYDNDSSVHKYIRELVDNSIQWYKNVLNIKRLISPLKIDTLNKETLEELEVYLPEDYYSQEFDADYLFFIEIVYQPESQFVGIANFLHLDSITNQPVIGVFQINYLEGKNLSYDDYLLTTIHEMAHALVFNPSLYNLYLDSSGEKYEKVVINEIVRGVEVTKIITPNVVERARRIFNCTTLNGVEFELNGGNSTKGAHWDKRIMYGDFMGPDVNVEDAVFSEITLALFEDSGWYKPNYEYTQPYIMGYNQGCGFLDRKCIEDGKPISDVFCLDDSLYHCDYKRLNKGSCYMKYHLDKIADEYSYFENNNWAGFDSFVDYCPIIYPIVGGNCRGLDFISTDLNPDYGEQACENCRCVEGTYSKSYGPHHHVACHWIECEDNYTIVHIGDEEVLCSREGGTASVPNYEGVLDCPKWEEVCSPAPCMNFCSGIGVCNRGVCECPDGSKGGDCSNIKKDFSYRDPLGDSDSDSAHITRILLIVLSILLL